MVALERRRLGERWSASGAAACARGRSTGSRLSCEASLLPGARPSHRRRLLGGHGFVASGRMAASVAIGGPPVGRPGSVSGRFLPEPRKGPCRVASRPSQPSRGGLRGAAASCTSVGGTKHHVAYSQVHVRPSGHGRPLRRTGARCLGQPVAAHQRRQRGGTQRPVHRKPGRSSGVLPLGVKQPAFGRVAWPPARRRT